MRMLAAAALIVLLAAPAGAQSLFGGDDPKDYGKEQKREEQERQYRAATQKIPDQKPAANDPWGNVRGTAEVKPDVKPKPKAAVR